MLDLIGEVLEGAKRNAFFWRINNISVTDGLVRNDDLRVAFGSKGSRFEQRFLKPDTLTINILSCFYIVNSVDDEV